MSAIALIDKALSAISVIVARREKYRDMNRALRELQGDFCAQVQEIDPAVEESIVGVLDAILGAELASYFLYEATSMDGGGLIIEQDGTQWPIRTIGDVRTYAMHRQKLDGAQGRVIAKAPSQTHAEIETNDDY